eukprot:6082668-Prymnesium_polylepis.1
MSDTPIQRYSDTIRCCTLYPIYHHPSGYEGVKIQVFTFTLHLLGPGVPGFRTHDSQSHTCGPAFILAHIQRAVRSDTERDGLDA